MVDYRALAVETNYWKPGENYLDRIVRALGKRIEDNDFVIISEKALSTARNNIIDESKVQACNNARLISKVWMRIGWGYPLGIMSKFGQRLLVRLRNYPIETGSRHKQTALEQAGLLQALMFGSEGGIDGSNLPYSFVSLPLKDPYLHARAIRRRIESSLKKHVCVIITDTDRTYSFRNFHFTPRPNPMRGILSFGGVFSYTVGRMLKLKRRPTPLAVAGCKLTAQEALKFANIADRARGPGAGATVWDMAARFKVQVTEVSWEMLENIKHKPIVIIRRAK